MLSTGVGIALLLLLRYVLMLSVLDRALWQAPSEVALSVVWTSFLLWLTIRTPNDATPIGNHDATDTDLAWTIDRNGRVQKQSIASKNLASGDTELPFHERFDQPATVLAAIDGAMTSADPVSVDVNLHVEEGVSVPLRLDVRRIASSGGQLLQVTARDLTELRDMESHVTRLTQELEECESRYKRLLQSVTDYVYTVKIEDGVAVSTTHSPGCAAVTGFTPRRFHSDPELWLRMVHEDDRALVLEQAARAVKGDAVHPIEHRIVHRDGSVRWIRNTVVVRRGDGRVVSYEGLISDITDRKRAEQAVQNVNHELRLTNTELELHATDDSNLIELSNSLQVANSTEEAYQAVLVFGPKLFPDSSGSLYLLSESREYLESAAGWGEPLHEEPVLNRETCWALRRGHVHDSRPGETGVTCQTSHKVAIHGYVCVPLQAMGETIGVLQVRFGPPKDHVPESVNERIREFKKGLVIKLADNIALSLANIHLRQLLRNQAIRDPLTGLFNRRYLEETLNREERRAVRTKSPIAILMIDIDHFKDFNDNHGHEAGDAALKCLGDYLNRNFRGSDIACRYGGEEFTVVLLASTAEDAMNRAEDARQSIPKLEFSVRDGQLSGLTVSIGVAELPTHGSDWKSVIAAADKALYQAKSAGRNRAIAAE